MVFSEKEKILNKIHEDIFNNKLSKKDAVVAFINTGHTREKAETLCKRLFNDKVKFELGLR